MNIGKNYRVIIAFTILPLMINRFIPREFSEKIMLLFFGIVVICFVIPDIGDIIYDALKRAGIFIGQWTAKILLFFVWITAVFPTGCLMKITGRDRLRLKKSEAKSYWVDNITQNTDYEYQF